MRTLQFDNKNILTHFKEGKLELAAKAIEEFQMNLGEFDFVLLIDYFKTQIKLSLSEGEIREATRFKRRLAAIIILRDYGFDSRKLIPELILPEGYKGKIILISISGGLIEPMVCLRSGDLWHREILREVEEEIKDIGLVSTFVYEIGGAHLRFENGGSILIWGTSDEFGTCDKKIATDLVQKVYPRHKIFIED